ncbi:MAG: amino acid ABC transporter substrate-binding protein [Geobacteraceae bacterium]|nr:amino acid ABC transporter substrate-binding protein [Geobacteraceae bacterium]
MIRGLLASIMVSLCLFTAPGWGAETAAVSAANSETLRLGERMYRDGILPSGEPMMATIRDDVQIQGDAFSCVSCHLRSGIGSMEGQILSPPTNGAKLYKPYYKYPPLLDPQYGRVKKGMWDAPVMNIVYRPAYTDKTLAEALLGGVDPQGVELNAAMPRYKLDDKNMEILIAYLKTLSAEPSPGVGKDYKYIRFATVIAGDVPEDERKEMMALLEAVMKHHNRLGQIKNRYQNMGKKMKAASFNYPVFTIVPWQLNGPPDTWKAQLEEYYRKEPVFALLGGLSAGDWQPMHEFSEQHKIPCLLPVTDLPVISDTDWYTLYFSKGIYQEGESAARFLGLNLDAAEDGRVLQVVEDSPRARALARGFQETWKDLGRSAPETINLAAGESFNPAKLMAQKKPAAILLWTAAGTVRALDVLAADKAAPKMVYVSATLLKKDIWNIPERARGITHISYPYRVDAESDFFTYDAKTWMKKRNVPISESRISTRLYALMNVLLDPFKVVKRDFNPAGQGQGRVIIEEQFETLMHVKRNYYRDYLFDVIGMFGDRPSLDYERFSFGPGQRYMSKGCFIVQLSAGPKPQLIKKSDWVIY